MRSWLSDLVGPRLREIVIGSADNDDQPAEPLCERCGRSASTDQWRAARQVCERCGYHRPLPVAERLDLLFSEGTDQVIELPATPADPLKFRDHRRYADRLREAEERCGRREAVTVAHGRIGDEAAVVAVMDPDFLDGTIGCAVGDGLLAAGRLAVIQEAALVLVCAPCGLRLQEGMLALAQIDRIAVAVDDARRVGLPCIAVLPAGATGTVAATVAALADVVIAEPDATPPARSAPDTDVDVDADPPQAVSTGAAVTPPGLPADLVVDRLRLPTVLAQMLRLIRRPRPAAEVLPLLPADPSAPGSLDDVATALADRRDPP